MSKGLKALKELSNELYYCNDKELTKTHVENKLIIEKELKALEIIKDLVNSFDELPCGKNVQEQIIDIIRKYINDHLTENKINLLKEVLI